MHPRLVACALLAALLPISRAAGASALLPSVRAAAGAVRRAADEDMECAVALVQTQFRAQRGSGRAERQECGRMVGVGAALGGDPHTMSQNNAKYHTHRADFDRPIPDVMAEHPGVDGFCYFNNAAMYIAYSGEEVDFVQGTVGSILGLRGPGYGGLNSGPEVTYHWEGDNVTTHLDAIHYVYDDLYGYSLGVLQGQGLETALLSNATAWEEVSADLCDKVQEEYQFSKEELILSDILDMNLPIMAMCYCAAGVPLPQAMRVPYITAKAQYRHPKDCKPITKREFARHHYMKCLLGHKNSGGDIAYLHARACLLDGGRIGHLDECPFKPPGV